MKRIGRTKAPNWTGIVKEIDKSFDTVVKRRLPEYPKLVTDNWQHQPDFPTKKSKGRDSIRMSCIPSGPNKDIWKWVSGGTGIHGPKGRPYRIPKSGTKLLAFPSVYTPKTKPGGPVRGFGGPGRSSGPTIFAMYVKEHPGIKGRRFVDPWARLARVWFTLEMKDAVKRGARRA
jgi:hypothetical protein